MLAILLPCLLTSVAAEFCTVKAQGMSIDVEFVSSPPTYVNQPFEIMATVSGGTPPYTYQWYTKWFPLWKPGMDSAQYVASSGNEIAVPEATSATFRFTPTVEGIYWISVGVSDSAGQSVSHFPSIQPFQLIVQNPQPLDFEKLFDVDLMYAYVQPGASSAIAVLNFTSISNVTLPNDSGITEVYTIQVFSGGNVVGTEGAIGCSIGKDVNSSFLMDLAMSFGHFSGAQGGRLRYCTVFYEPLNPTLTEPISISVIRLGWITVNGNATQTNLLHNETAAHVELSKYQNGFLYNKLLSQEQLMKINMFEPLNTAVTPTQTPTSTVPEFSWLAILPLLISLFSLAVVTKLKHRKRKASGQNLKEMAKKL
jgi:hypothetical protein